MRKYLERHAEPEAEGAAAAVQSCKGWGHVLCIPAYGEGAELLATLASVPEGPRGPVLIVLVVNEPAGAPQWARAANRKLSAQLRSQLGGARRIGGRFSRFDHPRGALLLVDRAGAGSVLPRRQGVGLARKIAADIALRVWALGGLRTPWLHGTDADVLLPSDYFERPLARLGNGADRDPPAALLYDFVHVPSGDAEQTQAVLRYEIFLRYYVLGLRYAGSPYAYHSLGSTVAVAPDAYAMVRGFPRRAAGEDFHLLAKLAKLGRLVPLRGAPIQLSGRISERVPFGTGAAIVRELRRSDAGEFFPAYDPRTFAWLRVWLRTLAELGQEGETRVKTLEEIVARHCRAQPDVDRESLWSLLRDSGVVAATERARGQSARQLFARFDALKTLRFLHAVRDRDLPALPLSVAIERAPFTRASRTRNLAGLRDELAALETSGAGRGIGANGASC